MSGTTRIDLFKEGMKFSAAHFTIFGAGERENLHGHNFTLRVEIDAEVGDDGLAFDYKVAKGVLLALCRELDEILLLPTRNPHLRIEERDGEVVAFFGTERMVFLARDVRLLPIRNVTVEELSAFILDAVRPELMRASARGVRRIATHVFSGPGQSASAAWVAG